MMKGKIPDRWEEYEPVGKVVPGTRFIAFKVPLNPLLSRSLPSDIKRFLPEDLPAAIREQDRELGLVIDLTNTRRYYREEDILNQKIEYKKIFTEGHSIPSKDVRNCFFETVDDFLSSNKDNDRVIGVHCTHGLNRTGYLVCRYMIDRMNFKADDAIKAFNEARGHDMERQNYLSDLRGEPISDEPSPNNDRRMERKRTASAKECLEDSAIAPHTDAKQRCVFQRRRTGTMDDHSRPSFTRQSGAGNRWSRDHNQSRSGQSSQSYHGNGNRRNYDSSYEQDYQQHMPGYDQHYNSFSREPEVYHPHSYHADPQVYYQHSYHADQNNLCSDGSWRQPNRHDRHDLANHHDFASDDFSMDFTDPGGWQFQRSCQRSFRPEYGRDCAAGRRTNYNDCHQQRNSEQLRGNNHS